MPCEYICTHRRMPVRAAREAPHGAPVGCGLGTEGAMVFMRRRALLLMGLLVRLRRARGGLRQHVRCGASMRGAVQACVVRCTRTVRGVASARTARPPRELRRRARWRHWRARGCCTAKEFCAAAAGRGDPYRILGPSLPWPGDPYPNPNRRGRFQRGRPGSGGAHGRCFASSRAACSRRPLYVLRCEPDSGTRLEKSKDHDNREGYALV